MNNPTWSQVDLIREAFYYQSRFDSSVMVFKIDFPLTEDPAFPYLMKDLALLSRIGIRVVIVPGAKEWIDSVLAEYGIVSSYTGSIRITTAAAIPFVKMAAFNVATRFMTALSAHHIDAVIGNFVRARGLGVSGGIDMEHTGTVEKVLLGPIGRVMESGMIPIIPCIGWSASGKPYNVASDDIALEASKALGAVKLFIVSAGEGIRAGKYRIDEAVQCDERGRLVRLTPQEAGIILKDNAGAEEEDKALSGLRLALAASRTGIERVHIIDGREDGAVLRELFSNLGAGTMVYADEYESIRPLTEQDIPDVMRLMEPLMKQGILLRRNSEAILEKIGDYAVFEIDGSIHACGALHDWGEGQGELAAIAVDPAYSDMGLGRRIIRYLTGKAKKQGFRRVFALTTKTHDWFELQGFKESPVESLPKSKRAHYDHDRKSKVFALEL